MRTRLVLLVVATSSLVLVGFVIPLAVLIRQTAADRAVTATSAEIQAMAPVIAGTDAAALREAVERDNTEAAHPVTVFLADGTVLGVPAPRTEAVADAATGRSITADVDGGREVLVAVAGRADGTAVIRAYVPASELYAGVAQSWATLGLLGCAVLLVCVLVAAQLARTLVRPLVTVAATAERLSAGDLAARAQVAGPREVRQVGAALNRLATRIGDLLALERESAADLSHRLRTPMTALRIDAEGLRQGPERDRVLADLEVLEGAVDEIIRLARRPPVAVTNRVCDAVAVTLDRADFWSALAEEEGRAFAVEVPQAPLIIGLDRDSFGALLDALLGNVFAHTPEGTPSRVSLHRHAQSEGAVLAVADHGPGLAFPAAAERGASGAGSTGLGLDIVRRTAAAAGGSMSLEQTPGGGLTVLVVLGPPAPGQIRGHRRPRRTLGQWLRGR